MDKQIESLMELLGCSQEQALDIVAKDKEIDKMTVRECESDLTQEQKAVAKKCRQGDRKPTVYKFDKKERKTDLDKARLINELANTIGMVISQDTDLTITNAERQIDFVYNGRKFRVVLSAPRS